MNEASGLGAKVQTTSDIIRRTPPTTLTGFIRTLVVDDTKQMAETVIAILERNPWISVLGSVENGLAGIQAALAQRPELILMDLNMPVMNGLVATMQIKQRLPETKIIIMSADDHASVAMAALDAGADGFMPKFCLAAKCDWHVQRLFSDVAQRLLVFGRREDDCTAESWRKDVL